MKKLLVSIITLIIIVIGIILIFNNQNDTTQKEEGKITITTSIYPIYNFTKEIAGDKANVNMLLSPGVEIHDFEPTPQDILNIENSDIFLYTGSDLEPWAETVISGMENSENVKDVISNVELIENTDGDEDEKYDSHIWLDPTISIQIAENITEILCQKDPENENYYRNNASIYISKLEKLDADIEEAVNNSEKKIIAFGGPFSYSYFIKRYNLEYISAYDSCGEHSEPSTGKIVETIKQIKENDIKVIFYKELSSGKVIDTIVDETGCEKLEFHSLHSISKQELDDGETYLTIMYKNLENLKKALQ